MSTIFSACEPASATAPPVALGGLQRRIRHLIGSLHPRPKGGERRREGRYPFPFLIRLTPLAGDGRTRLTTTIVVAGKDISEHGLGFFHPELLPYRRVVATLSTGDRATAVEVLVDLTWCRFTREGWYDGGGRFLVVPVMDAGDEASPAAQMVGGDYPDDAPRE